MAVAPRGFTLDDSDSAIFSVVYGVLNQPLPYPDLGRLITLTHRSVNTDQARLPASTAIYFTVQGSQPVVRFRGTWDERGGDDHGCPLVRGRARSSPRSSWSQRPNTDGCESSRTSPANATQVADDVSFAGIFLWLRGGDLNPRPLGYEPNELPDCSTPRHVVSGTNRSANDPTA